MNPLVDTGKNVLFTLDTNKGTMRSFTAIGTRDQIININIRLRRKKSGGSTRQWGGFSLSHKLLGNFLATFAIWSNLEQLFKGGFWGQTTTLLATYGNYKVL